MLTQNGFSRESAYEIVQSNAMEVWKTPSDKRKDLFQKLLLKDNKIISKVSKEDIIKQFDYNYHTKNVDVIFERVFKNLK